MISDRQAIDQLLQAWAGATREGRQDDVLAHHDAAVRIFDVLPPLQYTSAAAYRASWSEWQPDIVGAGEFAFEDLHITAGVDVGCAHGILQCGRDEAFSRCFVTLLYEPSQTTIFGDVGDQRHLLDVVPVFVERSGGGGAEKPAARAGFGSAGGR